MRLTNHSSEIRVNAAYDEKAADLNYLQNKVDMFMAEVEHMHLTVQTSHADARMLVDIMKELEKKYKTNLRLLMGNERRFNALLKLDQIYRTKLGPAMQELYDLCFDEISPREK